MVPLDPLPLKFYYFEKFESLNFLLSHDIILKAWLFASFDCFSQCDPGSKLILYVYIHYLV